MNEENRNNVGGARRLGGVRVGPRHFCKPVGRYVARVGLNASKGSDNVNDQ